MSLVNTKDIEWYRPNIVKALSQFNILSNATYANDVITIAPTGYAGCQLSDSYFMGLNGCKYLLVSIKLTDSTNIINNYINQYEIVLKGTYYDSDENIVNYYSSINITHNNIIEDGNDVRIARIVDMPNFNFRDLTIYVMNHDSSNNGNNLVLKELSAYRSQDIDSAQASNLVGLDLVLSQVKEYLDGMEVYFTDQVNPLKMWWHEDANGNFDGINVNNERLIPFSRINEVLLD